MVYLYRRALDAEYVQSWAEEKNQRLFNNQTSLFYECDKWSLFCEWMSAFRGIFYKIIYNFNIVQILLNFITLYFIYNLRLLISEIHFW